MRIMFVVATDLSANNSAAMCHNAYIRGMKDAGNDVSVITVDDTAKEIQGRINGVKYFSYSDENFLVRKIRKKRKTDILTENAVCGGSKKKTFLSKIKSSVYKKIVSMFGANITFLHRVGTFKSNEIYDLVISLASPADSHLVAYKLIKSKRLIAKKSCQIWEDPWAMDLYGGYNKTIFKKESKILSLAQKIIYVSPITMKNQMKYFPHAADKMDWLPLPSYFEEEQPYVSCDQRTVYGYFGQYFPNVRNLKPFYDAVINTGRQGVICGEPHDLFSATVNLKIYPRLSVEELNAIDKNTDVLVCLSNLGGGQIPGKIYQYSASTKPILFILDGTEDEKYVIEQYFSQFGRYVFCNNTAESIMAAMEKIESEKIEYKPIAYFTAVSIANEIVNKNFLGY